MVARIVLAGCLALGLGLPAEAAPPQRVVSINLCTDQLAMLLAAPGQLVSVSYLARDPQSSAMADEAEDYPINHGLAEEIYRLRPDAVLAGAYTAPTTLSMLRRLGVPVVQFPLEADFDGIRANILRMGAVLGREAPAEALAARFDSDLATLLDQPSCRPSAALYYADGYTRVTTAWPARSPTRRGCAISRPRRG